MKWSRQAETHYDRKELPEQHWNPICQSRRRWWRSCVGEGRWACYLLRVSVLPQKQFKLDFPLYLTCIFSQNLWLQVTPRDSRTWNFIEFRRLLEQLSSPSKPSPPANTSYCMSNANLPSQNQIVPDHPCALSFICDLREHVPTAQLTDIHLARHISTNRP